MTLRQPSTIVYSRARPSPRYRQLISQYRQMHLEGERFLNIPPEQTFPGKSLFPQAARIKAMIEKTASQTLLDYGSGKGMQYQVMQIEIPGIGVFDKGVAHYWGLQNITCYEPCYPPLSSLPSGKFDGVISTDVLEHCPEEDVPWIIEELFGYANRFVFANVACFPAKKRLPNGENAHCTIRPPEWWEASIRNASAKYPAIQFEFWIQSLKETPEGARLVEEKVSSA